MASSESLPNALTDTSRPLLLAQLRRRIQFGVERFLTATIRLPDNRSTLLSMGSPSSVATVLWQETLLFGFCVLATAISEAAELTSLATSRQQPPDPDSMHALLEELGSAELAIWPGNIQRLLHDFGDDRGSLVRPATNLARVLPEDSFRHLRALRLDSTASHALFASLLSVEPSALPEHGCPKHPQPLPFDRLSARDLADVFEAMLNLCPGIAQTTLYRHRCGRYDVVTAKRERSSKKGQSHKKLEEIRTGSFYLYASNERKSSGAYYTPEPLVEYLLNGTLTPARGDDAEAAPQGIADVLALRILDPAMGAGAFLLRATGRLADLLLDAAATQYASEPSGRDIARIPVIGPRLLPCLRNAATRTEAQALCRIAVASSCIYGVDRNPLAAAVTRLLLWLDCHVAGLDLGCLKQHIVSGDSLIGPRLEQLLILPHSGRSLELEQHGELVQYLRQLLTEEPRSASVAALVASWTGGVMLGNASGDRRYVNLLTQLASGTSLARCLAADPELLEQHRAGELAVCFELRFPEVFARPTLDTGAGGFSVVIGNPPWDAVKANSREILAEFDPGAFDVKTRAERDRLVRSLSKSPHVAARLKEYSDGFAQRKRAHDRQFRHQKLVIHGDLAGRQLDLFRLFIERSWQLLHPQGRLGLVVPSAFHTAAGAVGVRRLLLETGRLTHYVVFRNSLQLFEISRGFEFGLLLAEKSPADDYPVRVRFGLEQASDLLHPHAIAYQELTKSAVLSRSPYATISVASDEESSSLAAALARSGCCYSTWEARSGIRLRSTPTSVHRTHESMHFETIASTSDLRRSAVTVADVLERGVLLHEGATFNRYDDLWGSAPTYHLAARRVLAVARWQKAIGHYRIAMRAIVGSSPHKCIATLLPPGTLVTNSALVEAAPGVRPSAYALSTIAVLNSSTASWLFCGFADLNVNLFALRQLPWPESVPMAFLAHSALRLCANHEAWKPLWREQLGDTWREGARPFELPALPRGTARTGLVAAIDAIVAVAYGLTRQQYQRILGHFGSDWQGASVGDCLAVFDAVVATGTAEFARNHDPYAEVALVLAPPQSLLEVPGGRGAQE